MQGNVEGRTEQVTVNTENGLLLYARNDGSRGERKVESGEWGTIGQLDFGTVKARDQKE